MTFEDRHSTAAPPFASWALANLDLSQVATAADVGCGSGRFAFPLARALIGNSTGFGQQVEVSAVERDERLVADVEAKARDEQLPIRAIRADAQDRSSFPDSSLDLVMLNFVLHLQAPRNVQRCLANAHAWLRPEGSLLIAGYGSRHMSRCFDWLRDGLRLLGVTEDQAQDLARHAMRRSLKFSLQDGFRFLSLDFDVITYRRFEDTLLVGVDDLANLTLPSMVGSPALTRDIDVTAHHLQEAVVSVMNSAAIDGHLRVDTDLGILMASRQGQP